MKAAVLHELGRGPRCEEFAEPTAGQDEAVVRVRAAALKAVDRQLASRSHFARPRGLPGGGGNGGVGGVEGGTPGFFLGGGGARRGDAAAAPGPPLVVLP